MVQQKLHPVTPVPFNESFRVADLKCFDIMDSENEEVFNDLTELASSFYDCPIALLSFLDSERQWFKARKNIDICETSRENTFCAHVIFQEEILIVEDAVNDPRFMDHPEVKGGFKVGFYVGAPIMSTTGQAIGTICVIDTKPHQLEKGKERYLQMISRQITQLLDLRMKNKMMVQRADLLHSRVDEIIEQSDYQKSIFAQYLHENLAQTLTASKLYIELAVNGGSLSHFYLTKGLKGISDTLELAKSFSNINLIARHTEIDVIYLIPDLVAQFGKNNRVEIDYTCSTEAKERIDSKTGLVVFNVLQTQLRDCVLASAATIHVKLYFDQFLYLTVQSDKKITRKCAITEARVEKINGSVSIHDRTYTTRIPLVEENLL